jgi:lysozyme family protein
VTITDVVDRILEDEGGVADAGDGKGITRFGQTPQWLADYNLPTPSTPEQARANYVAWLTKTGVAKVIEKDGFVGWVVADAAVHFGLTAAIKLLQRALGITADGVLGPQTLGAVPVDSKTFARRIVANKGMEYGRLLASTSVDRRLWAKGWLARLGRQIAALP